jgi:glycosyltransferase involved in cell wall biosynthesis
MKIAILIRRYITTGGAERYAVEVARRLVEKHEVHIFAQEYDHAPEGMTAHRVLKPFRKPSFANQWWFSWWTSKKVRGFDLVYTHERITRFDVMHIHSGTFVGGIWGLARAEKKNHFLIWLKILTQPRIWAYWLLEKLHYRPIPGRCWIAVSEMIKREVQSYYPIPDDRFCIAHSGADSPPSNLDDIRNNWRKKLNASNQDVLLLFVGSQFDRKGLSMLIAAVGTLKDQPCKLLVLGGGNTDLYKQQAAALQIGDKIIFAGLVKNTSDYYAAADIFILPTLSDPSPLSPLEAMAHGCATIMSCGRYNGAAEHIKNNEAILLEDPRNPFEIAGAIERLMNPDIREAYSNKGRDLVRELSWDRTANIIIQTLEKSARERGRLK